MINNLAETVPSAGYEPETEAISSPAPALDMSVSEASPEKAPSVEPTRVFEDSDEDLEFISHVKHDKPVQYIYKRDTRRSQARRSRTSGDGVLIEPGDSADTSFEDVVVKVDPDAVKVEPEDAPQQADEAADEADEPSLPSPASPPPIIGDKSADAEGE